MAVLTKLMQIAPDEVSFVRRGFHIPRPSVRRQLECVGESFRQGYQSALLSDDFAGLLQQLEAVDLEFRGFSYEGAAMALDLLDQLRPWRTRRLPAFMTAASDRHVYMLHVGVGWSIARWPFRIRKRLSELDPILRWLALDGYGFHGGYFHWRRYAAGTSRPSSLRGYELRAFDQGLGRSLWFVAGAYPEHIAKAVSVFPQGRRADLWSGVGLACAYAGGCSAEEIERIKLASKDYADHVAQGAAFAVKTRMRAGNPTSHTEVACRTLCGLSLSQTAAVVDQTLRQSQEGTEPAYEDWRRRLRMHFGVQEKGASSQERTVSYA